MNTILQITTMFAALIAAPFCIGLLPALAMPGEHTAWSPLAGKERNVPASTGAEKNIGRLLLSAITGRRPVSVCPAAIYVAGLLLELALFQIIAVPVIIYKPWGFSRLVTLYTVLLAVLSLAGLLAGFPVLRGLLIDLRALWDKRTETRRAKAAGSTEATEKRRNGLGLETALYWLIAAALLLFQMYMAFSRAFFDGDDAYYVAQSVIAEQTDVLYRILPYTGLSTLLDWRHALAALPIWEAWLARISGIHPAIIAHTVLPLVILPVTYMVYFRIGMRLFHCDSRKTAMFLILVNLLQIFGNTSIYSSSTFFLMRTWQGKSILCNLVFLTTIWILLRLWDEKKAGSDEGASSQAGWWVLLCANNTVAAMATTMGAFLIGLFIAVAGLVIALRQKRPRVLPALAATCIPCLVYLAIYASIVM